MRGLRGLFSRASLICLIVFASADLLVLFTRSTWIGFLGYTPEWANAGLYVASPLIAGASAFLTRVYLSPELVAITRGRGLGPSIRTIASAWVRMVVLALIGHAAVMLIALLVSAFFGASGAIPWAPFVYAVMPISMACAIGVALAAIFPHVWSSGLAILTTYGLWYVVVISDAAIPANIGGATISLAGLQYRLSTLLILLAAAAVVTATFLTVAVLAVRRQSFPRSLTAFAVACFCLVLVGTVAGGHTSGATFEPSQQVDFVCEGSAPRICLTVDHSARLSEVAAAVQRAAQPLRDAGVDMETLTLREGWGEGQAHPDGELLLGFGQLNGIGVTESDYAHALLQPASCADYFVEEPTPQLERLFTAAQLLAEWLDAKRAGTEPSLTDDRARELYDALRACSVDEELVDDVDPQ